LASGSPFRGDAYPPPASPIELGKRCLAPTGTKELLMAFKLLDIWSQQRWRRLDGAYLLNLVRTE